ncbi:Succinate dehydrogenase cytochrome b subunit [uncultured Candidatus Thioglobus sp.]|nr:Succinate dehydrogenase cytochrome b subunit [uncultured Candidatus Thioglobus sp.]
MSPFLTKRIMALSGILWITYLIIHMLANLNFLTGEANFNGFYQWFNEAVILRWSIIGWLILSILFHVYTAIERQFDSNKKRDIAYKKPYPKAVPRLIAWSGAALLFSFIVFHFFQMQLLESRDFYAEMRSIFTDPIMLVVYALGFVSLAAHLHHALGSVGQTFGLTHKQHNAYVIAFVVFLVGGFALVPISIYL